ncbi:WG repeat-containing protein [Clostridium algoriphilum]|uniref:WG repeat-containing protein n=1 Tax=Clostridium algoriphilum TaxID=198347 RepID=UPI001CF25120|nr:WG repeat-containing protein [Clostridium algoriphilum]MCB2292651.1 WG repeat-containing protein [Clostridium algoriphilum]
MKKCIIYHTWISGPVNGVVKEGLVYIQNKNGKLRFPKNIFMAREECEFGLIQFEVEGKWGFADIYTGEIKIDPVFDYVGRFYNGYAHVAMETQIEFIDNGDIITHGGKHGYIDRNGKIIVPLKYDDAADIFKYCDRFKVALNQKWGIIDNENVTIIPLEYNNLEIHYDDNLIFCSIKEACELHVGAYDLRMSVLLDVKAEATCYFRLKWGVYDKNCNLIVKPELDNKPTCHEIKQDNSRNTVPSRYYILKRKRKYGVICEDGRLITDISLLKKEAVFLINTLSRYD